MSQLKLYELEGIARTNAVHDFLELVDLPFSREECWPWLGALNKKGYGNFRGIMAHRFSYTYIREAIPNNLQLDHECRNKSCVNPWHLCPVTSQENKLRATSLITHCPQGHPYDEENTYRYNDNQNKRKCKTCTREKSREWHRNRRMIEDQEGVKVNRIGRP